MVWCQTHLPAHSLFQTYRQVTAGRGGGWRPFPPPCLDSPAGRCPLTKGTAALVGSPTWVFGGRPAVGSPVTLPLCPDCLRTRFRGCLTKPPLLPPPSRSTAGSLWRLVLCRNADLRRCAADPLLHLLQTPPILLLKPRLQPPPPLQLVLPLLLHYCYCY